MSRSIEARLAAAQKQLVRLYPPPAPRNPLLGKYDRNAAGYAKEVLGQDLWQAQLELLRKLDEPPFKVLAKACHSVGKSHTGAVLVNHHFDTYSPGVCITTAPTYRDVVDVLWAQTRLLRARKQNWRGGFRGHAAPELWAAEDHYAKGYTASKGESFQGRHPERALWMFDEAVGVAPVFWQTTKSMFQPGGLHRWVCFFNPTDTSSQAYAEEMGGHWHIVHLSAAAHPNLLAELIGQPRPIPAAVSLAQFQEWLHDWAEPVAAKDAIDSDLQWPPEWYRAQYTPDEPARWYRPGPLMECRGLGRWPSQATYGVWSDWAWEKASTLILPIPKGAVPRIGCDVAIHGDDHTAAHVQAGGVSLHHERHHGDEPDVTAGRLKRLCQRFADWYNERRERGTNPIRPEDIPVNIDADGGHGWGVISHKGKYKFLPVHGMSNATNPTEYFNRRTENWFNTAKRAKAGQVSFARLDADTKQRLRLQFMAPRWAPNASGQCQVEEKKVTKKRLPSLGSPDDADAANLAHFESADATFHAIDPKESRGRDPDYDDEDGDWQDDDGGHFGRRVGR